MSYELTLRRQREFSFHRFCEVMISAIESPSKFFVQKAGPFSKELDRLIENMSEFYKKQDNSVRLAVANVSTLTCIALSPTFICPLIFQVEVGVLVAAFLNYDNNWYRAKVTSIEGEGNESLYHVSLLDFGDEVVLQRSGLAVLEAEFLKLKFQAIECQLANVKPLG